MTDVLTPERADPRRGRLALAAKILIGLAVLAWVLAEMDWTSFGLHVREISWPLFAVLVVMAWIDRGLMAYKWNLLLRANGVVLTTMRALRLYLVSNLLGALTPGGLGGDAYRVLALSPLGKSAAVFSTVVLERVAGLLSILIFVLAALPFSASYFGSGAWTVTVVAIGAVLVLLAVLTLPVAGRLRSWADRRWAQPRGKVLRSIRRAVVAWAEMQNNRRVVLAFVGLTLLDTGFFIFMTYVSARVAGVPVSFGFILITMPVVHFLLRLPVSIQGIGIQEGLFAYVLGLAGFSVAQGVVMSLVWRLMTIVGIFLPGYVLMLRSPVRVRADGQALEGLDE
ncbi:MAG: lysylphosphatidylglycerol synthase transmembrane domain-containing protein [Candidatus Krumholzibacteriia bacterium]